MFPQVRPYGLFPLKRSNPAPLSLAFQGARLPTFR